MCDASKVAWIGGVRSGVRVTLVTVQHVYEGKNTNDATVDQHGIARNNRGDRVVRRCMTLGYVTAVRGDFAAHRAWMIRGYASDRRRSDVVFSRRTRTTERTQNQASAQIESTRSREMTKLTFIPALANCRENARNCTLFVHSAVSVKSIEIVGSNRAPTAME